MTVRHESSRIVTVRANLATRLGSSRSANFLRGRCTLPEVHFRYPFSRHDFRCDGRDSRQQFVTGRNYPANRHDPSRSVTPFATRYGSGVLDMSALGRTSAIFSFACIRMLPTPDGVVAWSSRVSPLWKPAASGMWSPASCLLQSRNLWLFFAP